MIKVQKNKMPVPTESVEQQCLIRWAERQSGAHPELRLLYHIPNEGKRSKSTGARMRAEGLRTGVPDLCLPVARGGYHGLYIELKRVRDWTLSETQRQWIAALEAHGYRAVVCPGWTCAVNEITEYLSGRTRTAAGE